MASSSRGTISEDYDSDFDNSSHEDDEPTAHKDSVHELDEEEQHNELIVRATRRGLVEMHVRHLLFSCENNKSSRAL